MSRMKDYLFPNNRDLANVFVVRPKSHFKPAVYINTHQENVVTRSMKPKTE